MRSNWLAIILFIIVAIVTASKSISGYQQLQQQQQWLATITATRPFDTLWRGMSKNQIPVWTDSGKLIMYGYELISNTSRYLGPKGTVASITNGMNCQNCHLDGGTVPFGNNFGKVYATYPQFRARSNSIQTIYGRINDCLERSLNGKALDSNTYEMKAMYAYIKWLSADIPKGYVRGGTGIMKLPYLDVAADSIAGRQVYIARCQSCHGNNGQGVTNAGETGYLYPPLWGQHSYNDAAGLYRLSNFAGFVKNNMPYGTDYHAPQLTDKEAWNVAAFVNSQPRPHKDQRADWPDITTKPIDLPFGPYTDTFSEHQHKYGPYKPIIASRK
ncbi:MAG: c-type cytochrome [Chitinophagaceae bacterium]